MARVEGPGSIQILTGTIVALHDTMGSLFTDLRFAFRVLWKKPSLTAIVVLTLAFGIGAGSAMFSVIHALLVRPVDLPELDRLVTVQETSSRGEWNQEVSPRAFLDYQTETRSFQSITAVQWWEVTVTAAGGDPERVLAYQVSPGYFDTLGVAPLLGRWFAADEVDRQNDHVVILSHRYWQRRFGGDPAILGATVTLDSGAYTVVGVMPPGFRMPNAAELWAPLTLDDKQRADRASRYTEIVAKLAPGVSIDQADAEMRLVAERHAAAYPQTNAGRKLRVISLVRGLTEDFTRDFIYLLFGAAIFVLLIACANVANVFLAHAMTRRREMAVRTALGAGRGRIVRQLLTEAALLGLLGGAASLFVAAWSLELIKGGLPATITRYIAGWEQLGIDGRTLGFAVATGILVGMVFGVVPAIQVSRTDVNSVLKDGDRGTTGGRRAQRMRSLLVVAQVALSLILLLGAGAMVQGFQKVNTPRHGIDTDSVLGLRAMLPFSRYEKDHQLVALERRVLDGLRALPGVEAAAVSNVPWGQNGWGRTPRIEGEVVRPEERVSVDFRAASPGYLEQLRVPLLAGRLLGPADDAEQAPLVAVVSDAAARRYWPGGDAPGKRLRFSDDGPWITVIGVVADIEERIGERGPRPTVYMPFSQTPSRSIHFTLRGGTDPRVHARAALAVIHAADPLLPVSDVRTLRETRDERFAGIRLGAAMMGAFALLALLLAVVGSYGVAANLVTQRTHEIGVRMALGARRADVLRLVLGRGALLTTVGVVIGFGLGVALVRAVDSVLVGLVAGSTLSFVAVAAAVGGCALFGCFVPARRATQVDPMIALRHD